MTSDREQASYESIVNFTEKTAKRKSPMRALFPTARERDRVIKEYGALEGGKQTLARLDQYVSSW